MLRQQPAEYTAEEGPRREKVAGRYDRLLRGSIKGGY
jgi:hypothetical protein